MDSFYHLQFQLLSMKSIYSSFLLLACASLLVSACEEKIDIDLNSVAPKVVIEGAIRSDQGPYSVKVTRTVNYYGTFQEDFVSGARLVVSDNAGNIDTLKEVRPGYYETTTLVGTFGRTYTLNALVNGNSYTASEYLQPINPIDTLTFRYDSGSLFMDPGYYVTFYAQETPGRGNYYQNRFWINDSLLNHPTDYLFSNDDLFDGSFVFFEFPFTCKLGDTVVVEVRSISKAYYDFLITVLQETNNSGSPFSSMPDNLAGNISNEGLGYFSSFGIARDTIIIQ